MLRECDYSQALLEQVNQAISDKTPLVIQGSNSKAFLGRPVTGQTLDVRCHRGIVNYDPTELVITARAGTPLVAIEAALESAGQTLPRSRRTTVKKPPGAGWSPAGWRGRVARGAVRSAICPRHAHHYRRWKTSAFWRRSDEKRCRIRSLTVNGRKLRLLGVLTEISMKVLPRPRASLSLRREISLQEAMSEMPSGNSSHYPLVAYVTSTMRCGSALRAAKDRKAARELLGGEEVAGQFWQQLREQQLPFFSLPGKLRRIPLPSDAPMTDSPGEQLIDWGGALRWRKSTAEDNQIHRIARNAGGDATRFSAGDGGFAPLSAPLFRHHQQLKQQLDPCGVFNPGRMYAEL